MKTVNLVPDKLVLTLQNAKLGGKSRVDIPNSHPVMAEYLEDFQLLGTLLGMDWAESEHTITLVDKGVEKACYAASIIPNTEGKAVIKWGKAEVLLSSIKDVELSVTGEKGFSLECYFPEPDVVVYFPIAINTKEYKDLTTLEIKSAIRQGTLGQYLRRPFVKPVGLKELKPGIYNVIGYESKKVDPYPEPFVSIVIEGYPAPFKANRYLKNRLSSNELVITKDMPATLEVGESTGTVNGHPVIPVILKTQSDKELPVYDFSLDDSLLF